MWSPTIVIGADRTRRKLVSLKTIRWSKHSDRADLPHLSATALTRGDLNGMRTCRIPRPASDDRSLLHSGCRDHELKIAVALDPRRSIPRFAVRPASCRMPRHFNVEDLSVCKSDDEDGVKHPAAIMSDGQQILDRRRLSIDNREDVQPKHADLCIGVEQSGASVCYFDCTGDERETPGSLPTFRLEPNAVIFSTCRPPISGNDPNLSSHSSLLTSSIRPIFPPR